MDYLVKGEVLTNTDLDRFVNNIWEKYAFCVHRKSRRSLSSAHDFIFLFMFYFTFIADGKGKTLKVTYNVKLKLFSWVRIIISYIK